MNRLHELAPVFRHTGNRLEAVDSVGTAIVLDAIAAMASAIGDELVDLRALLDRSRGAAEQEREPDGADARGDRQDEQLHGPDLGLVDRPDGETGLSSTGDEEHEGEDGQVHAGDSANLVRMRCPYCDAVVLHGPPAKLLELARSMTAGIRCGSCTADVTTDALDYLDEAVAR